VNNKNIRTFGSSLLSMRLHCDMRIEMVKGAIRLLASVPTTLVHALNLFVSPTGSLVLLRARNWNERVHGGEWVSSL
jgi:hypothetical protein